MLINLSDVLSERHQPVIQNILPQMNQVKLPAGTFPVAFPDPVNLEVTHVKDQILRIEVQAIVSAAIPCDRCLSEVLRELRLCFAKEVDFSNDSNEEIKSHETNYIDGYYLNVNQLLYNEIMIGWPMKVLCCEDCKGFCSVCGQNLNEGACDCEDTSLDPRMSAIRDVFKKFKEV